MSAAHAEETITGVSIRYLTAIGHSEIMLEKSPLLAHNGAFAGKLAITGPITASARVSVWILSSSASHTLVGNSSSSIIARKSKAEAKSSAPFRAAEIPRSTTTRYCRAPPYSEPNLIDDGLRRALRIIIYYQYLCSGNQASVLL